MRAIGIVRNLFRRCADWCHQRRFESVTLAVEALLIGGRLSLTELGRRLASKAYVKHSNSNESIDSLRIHDFRPNAIVGGARSPTR